MHDLSELVSTLRPYATPPPATAILTLCSLTAKHFLYALQCIFFSVFYHSLCSEASVEIPIFLFFIEHKFFCHGGNGVSFNHNFVPSLILRSIKNLIFFTHHLIPFSHAPCILIILWFVFFRSTIRFISRCTTFQCKYTIKLAILKHLYLNNFFLIN